ncbi:hypothetical protein AMJ57_03340 [Parcubacteria bacterium SG8_24]|nr:MAG: hypothetical protein AMJ57_03340 [Parcubacteria bacterium SG8_24]
MGEIIVDWKALGVDPPEGEKPQDTSEQEADQDRPQQTETESGVSTEIDAALAALEARHPREASFRPNSALALEALKLKERIEELTDQRDEQERAIEGGTMFASLEKMRQIKEQRKQDELGEFDRQIEDLGIDLALLESAMDELKSGDTSAADAHFAKQEKAIETEMDQIEEQEAAARRKLQEMVETGAGAGDLTGGSEVIKRLERQKARLRSALSTAKDRREYLRLLARKKTPRSGESTWNPE